MLMLLPRRAAGEYTPASSSSPRRPARVPVLVLCCGKSRFFLIRVAHHIESNVDPVVCVVLRKAPPPSAALDGLLHRPRLRFRQTARTSTLPDLRLPTATHSVRRGTPNKPSINAAAVRRHGGSALVTAPLQGGGNKKRGGEDRVGRTPCPPPPTSMRTHTQSD